MKIYISGKITGLPIEEAQQIFADAADQLAIMQHEPINPMAHVPYNPDWQYHDYMAEDVRLLLQCDAIYMLHNWHDSKGARIERAIAMEAGITVHYHNNHSL